MNNRKDETNRSRAIPAALVDLGRDRLAGASSTTRRSSPSRSTSARSDELAAVREQALALGAVRAHVIDAREEFVRDFMLPALQAGVLERTVSCAGYAR